MADFIDAGTREPNEEGTGRWVLTPSRNTIKFVDLGASSSGATPSSSAAAVSARIFHLLATFFNSKLAFVRGPSPIPRTKSKYRSLQLPGVQGKSVEIWSILDALMPHVANSDYALVALSPWPLYEDFSEPGQRCTDGASDDVQAVLGRACGNRVAVVHAGGADVPFFELCCTTLHEVLHLCGFDHTTAVQCLMNPSPYEPCVSGTLFLCPPNLLKLCLFLGVEDDEHSQAAFVAEHYAALRREWGAIFPDGGGDDDDETGEIVASRRWLDDRLTLIAHHARAGGGGAAAGATAAAPKKRKQPR